MASPHQRRHTLVRAIVGSFGDQLPRVGAGQRFRIATDFPMSTKSKLRRGRSPPIGASTHPSVTPMTATEAKTVPQDPQTADLLGWQPIRKAAPDAWSGISTWGGG